MFGQSIMVLIDQQFVNKDLLHPVIFVFMNRCKHQAWTETEKNHKRILNLVFIKSFLSCS